MVRQGYRFRLAGLVVALCLLVSGGTTVQAQQPVTVTLGIGGEPDSLDMIGSAASIAHSSTILQGVFDRLVRINPASGEVGPELATSWRMLDPQTYLLVLRRGVKFHNGEDFTAETAKFTLDLLLSSRSFFRSRVAFITKVEAVDQYTLRIQTSQPDIVLPAGLGDVPMYPKQYYQQVGVGGFSVKPVGTGPFRFDGWDKGARIVLVRNDTYWGTKPQVTRLVFRPFVESATRLAALQAGEIDVAFNVPPDDAALLKTRGYQIVWTPIGMAMVLHFKSLDDSPLRDRRVRQALNYALDKDALIKNIMLGYAKPLDGQLVGPDGFGYNPNLKPYPFDLDRARRLLAEAGFPNGLTIRMDTSEGRYTKQREMSEALVGQLARVGVRVQLESHEWATFVNRLYSRVPGGAPMGYVGWAYYPAMDSDFVVRHFTTDSPLKFFANRTLDDLYNRQRAEASRAKRRDLLREAHAVLREEAPVAFLFQAPSIFALNARVGGFRPTPDDKIHFEAVSVTR